MHRLSCGLLLVAGLVVGQRAAAQAVPSDTAAIRRAIEQRFGRNVSMADVLRQLRASGISREQMRSQLRSMGLDPALADQYYDAIESGRSTFIGEADADFIGALQQMGLLQAPVPEDSFPPGLADTVRVPAPAAPDAAAGELPLFGRSFFRDTLFTIDPMVMGPVDREYIVGPGDVLTFILTGAVEAAYGLTIGRDGTVVIPEVGQVFVAGMTLDQVETRLLPALQRVYTDVGTGPEALTQLNVSIGRVRAVQVYVSGDVQRPGSYTVSALATVMDVLQRAGGPTREGSFRNVQVRRRSGPGTSFDLYDYLVRGDGSRDVRVQQGDVVFVPPAGPQVAVNGAVRRPAVYELIPGEDLVTALEYAGGIRPEAAARQVRIERILSPIERRPGVDRVVLTADLVAVAQGAAVAPTLAAGDEVFVPDVSDERRRFVGLYGAVNRPGQYAWEPGLDLADVLARAQGTSERALLDRVHVFRVVPGDPNRHLYSVDLRVPDAFAFTLAERDSIVVYQRDSLAVARWVRISGQVKRPGTYAWAQGMSPMDLVVAAGGFTANAYLDSLDVVRRSGTPGDTTVRMWRIPVSGGPAPAGPAGQNGATPATGEPLDEPALAPDDEVHVLIDPAHMLPRTVVVTGEVGMPGPYSLVGRVERLRAVIARAGGTRESAYVPGIRLYRNGEIVSMDARAALADPESPANVPLVDGDSIHVPRFNPTIRVTGAVTYSGYVAYRPGADLEYYIEQAGGYRGDADESRVAITGPDGRRQTVARGLLRGSPVPVAGSEIYVPERTVDSRSGMSWGDVLTRTVAFASTVATLIFAVQQLR
jgi:protein involved in polysaccharide export with SLBB domain